MEVVAHLYRHHGGFAQIDHPTYRYAITLENFTVILYPFTIWVQCVGVGVRVWTFIPRGYLCLSMKITLVGLYDASARVSLFRVAQGCLVGVGVGESWGIGSVWRGKRLRWWHGRKG